MWRPADTWHPGWMCLVGVVMVILSVLESLDHLVYEPLEIWQIMVHAMCGALGYFVYRHFRKQKEHLKNFEAWSKRRESQSLYDS